MGYLLGCAETIGGDGLLQCSLVESFGHVGLDETGSQGIDGDTTTGNLLSQGLGSSNDATLGSRVVGLTRQSLQTADTRHIDDASEFMELHGREQGLCDVEETRERDVEHTMPVVFRHEGHHIVATDACIVDHDLDILAIVLLLPLRQGSTCLFTVADIEAHELALTTNEVEGLLGFSVVAGIIDDDMIALLGQSLADGATNAAAASCYDCVFHLN